MDREIREARRHTQGYRFVDGFGEMATGAVLAALGLLFLAEALAPGAPKGLSAYGMPLVLGGGAWLAKRVVARAQERHTFPRTGRVVYRCPGRWPRTACVLLSAVAGAGIVAGLVVLLRAHPALTSWLPLWQGAAGTVMLVMVGHNAGLARLYVVALFSVVLGGVLSFLGLAESAAAAIYFTALGAALAASGAFARRDYLRQAPPVDEK